MFGVLHKRPPQELGPAGITGMANRFLKQVYLPDRRFPPVGAALGPSPAPGRHLCVHERRSNDDTARYEGHGPQIPADRHHYVNASVRVHEYPAILLPSSMAPGAALGLTGLRSKPARPRDPLRLPETSGRTAASRPTTSPQVQPPQRKRSINWVRSKCSWHVRHCFSRRRGQVVRFGALVYFLGRRVAGAVERGGLENRCTRTRTEGSNPSLSANTRFPESPNYSTHSKR